MAAMWDVSNRSAEAKLCTHCGSAITRRALIVGTALNLINQGDALLGGTQPVVWKLILTYVVPFAVASYGSHAGLRSTR